MSCSRTHIAKSGCSPKKKPSNEKTLEELISEYQNERHLREDWGKKRSIPEAVFGDLRPNAPHCASDVLPEGAWDVCLPKVKANSHQSRYYSKSALRKITEHLAANWNRHSFKDFEDLYDYVYSILVKTPTNPKGVVANPYALIIYDIALRLAYRFEVWPEKYVYLNGSGPAKGVEALGLGKYIKKDKKKKTILRTDIVKHYPELGELDAAQLEDFLCIYHNVLNRYKRK